MAAAMIALPLSVLSGSDVFYGTHLSRSADGGRSWGEPVSVKGLSDQRVKLKFPSPKGRLFLTFDDRYFDSWTNALPVFARYDAHATFFVCGAIDAKAVGAMRTLADAGHSLGFHGAGHRMAVGSLKQMGEQGYYEQELKPQLDAAAKAGLRVRNWGYPFSDRSDRTDAVLFRHFDRLRTGGFWNAAPSGKLAETDGLFHPPAEAGRVRLWTGASVGRCRPTVTGEVSRVLGRLSKTGESVLLYAHNIRTDGRHDDHDLQLSELETILSEAKRLGVRVLGFDEDTSL